MNNLGFVLPQLPVSYLTIVAAVVLLISLIVGWKKGILKTVLSLAALVGAVCAAIFLFKYVFDFLATQDFVNNNELLTKYLKQISMGLTGLVAFIVLSIVAAIINRILRNIPVLGTINKILGMILQLVIGALFVIILVYALQVLALDATEDSPLMQIINNAQVDPVGKFLIEHNLLMTILDWLVEKVPALAPYLEGLTSKLPATV